jgi:Tol biopolymer transport system component
MQEITMHRRKLMILFAIALAALFVLTACGGNEPEPEPTTAAADSAEPAAEAAEESVEQVTEEAAEEAGAETEATDEATEEASEEGAENATSLELVSARPVTEVVSDRDAVLATLSPDGSHIAWITRDGRGRKAVGELCLFGFDGATKNCFAAPEEFDSYPYQLAWAPDSSAIAFTENVVVAGLESDLWIFNVADGSFANRTDDGVYGAWNVGEDAFALDLLPMWSPDSSSVYFWRVEPLGDLQYNLGVFQVGASEGEAEQVLDLTDSMAGFLPRYSQSNFALDGMSALSPDGSQIAVLLTDMSSDMLYGATPVTLWLLDLAGTTEPTELMTSDQLQAALPTWQNLPANPQGVSWMGDGSAVVVNAFSNDTHSPLNLYYYVDVASGDATPVVDFSGAASMEDLFSVEETPIPLRYYAPWTASLTGDDASLVMFNDLGGTAGVLEATLPPAGALPEVLRTAESLSLIPTGVLSSRSDDGKVLMSGILFSFE